MYTLTTCDVESSFLQCGAWSVLLHVGAIAMLGALHVARPVDTPTPPVTVTLLKPPAPVLGDTPPVAPPMPRAEPVEQPGAPRQALPPPHALRLSPQRTVDATDNPPLPTRPAVPPATGELLLNHRASETVKLKQFTKAPARRTAPGTRAAAVPQEARHPVIAKPATATVRPFHEAPTPALAAARTNARHAPKVFRDTTADRKGLRTTVRPIKADRPPYPPTARARGWEGTVMLRLTVTREGAVERAAIHTSSGFPILDESALRAVQAWRFEPARDGEFAIPATVKLPVRFALDDP